jgi:uncharacterized protein
MSRFKKILFSFVLVLTTISIFAQVQERPNPPQLVNDFTNTLTPQQKEALEQKLVALDDSTSTQIAVVILPTVGGRTIADYNAELLRKWEVGSKKNNNGVVLLIAKDDRTLDISVGYGLEGSLTDATSKQIIDEIIVPNFKGNDYYRGIDEGTNAIMQAVKGQYHTARVKSSGGSGGSSRIVFFIVIIIIIMLLSKRGGGGGTFMSRRGQTGIADAILWSTLLGGGRGGGWSGGGGGGGWSGGGGGGGFGGFGGGSGGGGGASGSW